MVFFKNTRTQAYHPQRRVFSDCVFKMHENGPEFHRKIILTDEPHFHLSDYVKKLNYPTWGWKKTQKLLKSLSILKVQPFGAVYVPAGSLDLTFFKNKAGATVKMNGLRYREMMNDFVWPELDGLVWTTFTFNQTQATKPSIFYGKRSRTMFSLEGMITIGYRDLMIVTPCDFFLWGNVKDKAFDNCPGVNLRPQRGYS